MIVHNGLRNRPRLTQNTMRKGLSETVRSLQDAESDQEFSEQWGVSAGTVANARNQNSSVSLLPFLQLADRFGADALNTVLSLVGAKAVNLESVTVDISAVPCDVARVLPLLIELFRDGECCDGDVRVLDKAGAIDALIGIADMLRSRRDEVRTGARLAVAK